MAKQRDVNNTILELQTKGNQITHQIVFEERRIEEIDAALWGSLVVALATFLPPIGVFTLAFSPAALSIVGLGAALHKARSEIHALRLSTKSGAIDVLNLHRTTANPAHQRADGVEPSKLADENQKKTMSNMEARFNKLVNRQSEIISVNNDLKDEINNLRKERIANNKVRARFEADIQQVRGGISTFMAQASMIDDRREELVKAKEDLLTQNREAKERFAERMEELSEFIDKENNLSEESIDRVTRGVKHMSSSLAMTEKAGNLTVEEEDEVRARLKEIEDGDKEQQAKARVLDGKIKWYEKAFEELKTVSNIDDLDRLIAVSLKQEEEHFSMFNYIQTVNQETDQHLEKTGELEVEIKKYEDEENVREGQRVAIIRDLQQRAEEQRAAHDAWARKVEEAQAVADGLSQKAQSICSKIQCDHYLQAAAKDATGERAAGLQAMLSTFTEQGITVSNIVDYMGLIEQRSVQVMKSYTKILAATNPEVNLVGDSVEPDFGELRKESDMPNVSEDDSESDEANEEDMPISLSETRKELEGKMSLKVAAMRQKMGLRPMMD